MKGKQIILAGAGVGNLSRTLVAVLASCLAFFLLIAPAQADDLGKLVYLGWYILAGTVVLGLLLAATLFLIFKPHTSPPSRATSLIAVVTLLGGLGVLIPSCWMGIPAFLQSGEPVYLSFCLSIIPVNIAVLRLLARAPSTRAWLLRWLAACGVPLLLLLVVSAMTTSLEIFKGASQALSVEGNHKHLVAQLTGHSTGTRGVAYSLSGTHLLAVGPGSEFSRLQVWQVGQGQQDPKRRTIEVNDDAEVLATGAHGRTLAVGTRGEILLISRANLQITRRLKVIPFRFMALDLSDDGRWLVGSGNSGGTNHNLVWDAKTGAQVYKLWPDSNRYKDALAFTPEGDAVICAGPADTMTVTEIASGKTRCSMKGQPARVTALLLHRGGRTAVTADDTGVIRRWDLERCAALGVLATAPKGVTAIALSPDGKRLASGDVDSDIHLWAYPAGTPAPGRLGGLRTKGRVNQTPGVISLAFAPGGGLLAVGTKGNLDTIGIFKIPPTPKKH